MEKQKSSFFRMQINRQKEALQAGIKTVMITGDHKITAVAIAKKLGILENEEEALTGLELDKISDEELTQNIRKYSDIGDFIKYLKEEN